MTATITFHPLGNADCTIFDLADHRLVVFDFADVRNSEDEDDQRCDLDAELKSALRRAGQDSVAVLCVTHLDDDHCHGIGDTFRLDHRTTFPGESRVSIGELWVPAAAILETNLTGDAALVQREAMHRLRQGHGVRVFSRPERLRPHLMARAINFDAVAHLFVDAGTCVPGFELAGPERCEFFIHSPFASKQEDGTYIDRNENSIVLQAVLREGTRDSRVLLASDVTHEALADIVRTSEYYGNAHRLEWDLIKLPHHCSYLSIGPERGTGDAATVPIPETKRLFEDYRADNAVIVSTSWSIPKAGTAADRDKQPPHRQAANYHRRLGRDAAFRVTMEQPSTAQPKPFGYKATAAGIAAVLAAPNAAAQTARSNPRAG
ncbi:hypothetical protein [Jannaschia rubra]|uniref:Metallo-beta-lactamase domain-containing protein n=1 Tax=Jannaschia rubra TaxID=282197 RepID=A0A0M6XXL4_9RHOB|nr:hypothetical protein [Jannaschia rubra]CTQ34815.1 hypothetical protein JAN5088_03611 [Jannaschia rubra]SFG67669.1 hypothetical protein SAMN04488517_11066 [Jannaschia rubra]